MRKWPAIGSSRRRLTLYGADGRKKADCEGKNRLCKGCLRSSPPR